MVSVVPGSQSSLLLRKQLLLHLVDEVLHKTRTTLRTIDLRPSFESLSRSMPQLMNLPVHIADATVERRASE